MNTLIKNSFIIPFRRGGGGALLSSSIITHSHRNMNTLSTSYNESLKIQEIKIPTAWGHVSGQVFSNSSQGHIHNSVPILCLHGYLDNSNSFKPLAAKLCNKTKDYHIIALDLPGHGLSAHLPRGVPYTFKHMIQTVRMCVKHLGLESFIFMCHSYGIGLSYFYQLLYPEEAKANISIDWVFSVPENIPEFLQNTDFSVVLRDSIDKFIEFEESEDEFKKTWSKKVLTREKALEALLKSNNHLDEGAAKCLLERGMRPKSESGANDYEFTRDYRAKLVLGARDHFIDPIVLVPELLRTHKTPTLFMLADPPSYGKTKQAMTMNIIRGIQAQSKESQIEIVTHQGTHHFHMIDPEPTSQLIFNYLNKINAKELVQAQQPQAKL